MFSEQTHRNFCVEPYFMFLSVFHELYFALEFQNKKRLVPTEKYVFQGQSAGLIKAKVRGTQTFDVSVNVAAGSFVSFKLDYQELLKRRLGVYNHVIYADPGQVSASGFDSSLVCCQKGLKEISFSISRW